MIITHVCCTAKKHILETNGMLDIPFKHNNEYSFYEWSLHSISGGIGLDWEGQQRVAKYMPLSFLKAT